MSYCSIFIFQMLISFVIESGILSRNCITCWILLVHFLPYRVKHVLSFFVISYPSSRWLIEQSDKEKKNNTTSTSMPCHHEDFRNFLPPSWHLDQLYLWVIWFILIWFVEFKVATSSHAARQIVCLLRVPIPTTARHFSEYSTKSCTL